jgi:hypothetical protein
MAGHKGDFATLLKQVPEVAGNIDVSTYFGLAANSVVVTSDVDDKGPDMPEPATWWMMILGFGLIGVALRRQRQSDVRYAWSQPLS